MERNRPDQFDLKDSSLPTKFQYPELGYEFIEEKIEKIKKDIWLEFNSNLTALEKDKSVQSYLF